STRRLAAVLQVHHYKNVILPIVEVIGFPSFHTIWACIIAYTFRKRTWLFIVAIIYALLVMISTLTTGWHFLASVIAGVVVAALTIWVSCLLLRRLQVS
ncbi:unnamed protein product, partial [marine sediment metagenome]